MIEEGCSTSTLRQLKQTHSHIAAPQPPDPLKDGNPNRYFQKPSPFPYKAWTLEVMHLRVFFHQFKY